MTFYRKLVQLIVSMDFYKVQQNLEHSWYLSISVNADRVDSNELEN